MEVFFSAGMGKGNKYSQDQSRIMLLFEHNFRHNDVILRVTIKSKMLKFSGIMYHLIVHFFAVTTRLRRETA